MLLLLLLLNPKRALSKGVFLSRAAIRRKSLQESRDTKLKYSSSLDERSLFFGQNFFSVNFLSLSLSLSLSKFVSLSKKTFRASFLCGPFVLLLFAAFSCCLLFVCLLSSSFLPPQKRESIIYLHLSNDDDAFLFCEDSPNGGGREHKGTLMFLLFQILSLRFCCCRRLRRLVRILRSLFVCLGAEILFNG